MEMIYENINKIHKTTTTRTKKQYKKKQLQNKLNQKQRERKS